MEQGLYSHLVAFGIGVLIGPFILKQVEKLFKNND